MDAAVRDLREAVHHLDDPDTGRTRVVPEVVRSDSVSNGGRTYTFELKRTFRFHNGAPVTARSFADAFNRTANPKMTSPARRRGLLGEITGADAVREERRRPLRRAGARPLPPADPTEAPAGDFRRSPDDAVLLSDPAGDADRPDRDRRPAGIGAVPHRGARPVPAHGAGTESLLPRGRTANPDRIVWTIEPDPRERIRATERDENDFTNRCSATRTRSCETSRTSTASTGPEVSFPPTPTLSNFIFAFNPDRPAFKGVGQAPLRKAINYALDRQALTRAHGYLTVRRTDRLLPAALSESRRFYPLRGADPVTARRWLARAGHRPKTLTLYTANLPVQRRKCPGVRLEPEATRHRGRRRVLRLRDPAREARTHAGEPWDVVWLPWGSLSRPGRRPHPASPRHEVRGADRTLRTE